MEETRTDRTTSLEEQLAHLEATGELLPDARLIEGVARADRYLQAVELAQRARPGGESSLTM